MHDLDLQNGPRSNVNMRVENPYATSYLMAFLIMALLLFLRYSVEICMDLTLAKAKSKYVNQWYIFNFIFDGKNNVTVCMIITDELLNAFNSNI